MRPLALLLCVLGCAEWRMPPTFPERAAGRPVVHEQALLGLSPQGDAAVAELVEADGAEPHLELRIFAGLASLGTQYATPHASAVGTASCVLCPQTLLEAAAARGRTRCGVRWVCTGHCSREAKRSCTTRTVSRITRLGSWTRRAASSAAPSPRTPRTSTVSTTRRRRPRSPVARKRPWACSRAQRPSIPRACRSSGATTRTSSRFAAGRTFAPFSG